MAEKKAVKKTVVKPAQSVSKKVAAVKPVAVTQKAPAVVCPSARNCPLVLDGEVDASDFSETDCLTCGEFDCRFCEAQHGSGSLKSRLFAGSGDEDSDDEGEEGWDLDFGEGDEGGTGGEEEGEGEEY